MLNVQFTARSYLALCALVRDALEIESDATPILRRLAEELATAHPVSLDDADQKQDEAVLARLRDVA